MDFIRKNYKIVYPITNVPTQFENIPLELKSSGVLAEIFKKWKNVACPVDAKPKDLALINISGMLVIFVCLLALTFICLGSEWVVYYRTRKRGSYYFVHEDVQ